jgi:hypothetical protein
MARLQLQVQQEQDLWAFLYRLGDDASNANVWRGSVEDVTGPSPSSGENAMPEGFEAFLWFKLKNFEPVNQGWVLDNLDSFDAQQPLTSGALRNQTTPLYVAIRGSSI